MYLVLAPSIVCILSLISAAGPATGETFSCTDCIIVNNSTGNNNPSCFPSNTTSTTPCKTLSYVLGLIKFVSNREVVLQGDHYISCTLTVSDVNGLTIRGSDVTKSTIYCRPPNSSNDTGSGLVFESLSNLSVFNVIFEGCGTLQYSTTLRDGVNVRYRSAVYILNCTNIHFSQSTFFKSVGRGLSLHDVGGRIDITNCNLSNNMVPEEEKMYLFGGGGLYIEFTYCTPGYPNCNYKNNTHNKKNSYTIKGCVFEGNRATNKEVIAQIHTVQFRLLAGSDGNNAGQGSGIHATFKGTSSHNSIAILNSLFYNNSAQYGGGIDAIFQDDAVNNTIYLSGCTFTNNHAQERGGGALQLGYVVTHNVAHNDITVQDTEFVNNSAGWGGAVGFFSSRSKMDVENKLNFINCTWIGNSASVGAALSLAPSAWDSIFVGVVPTPLLYNCSFINNHVVDTAEFLKSTSDGTSQHVLESGVLNIESFEIEFSNFVSFSGSKGSAVFATAAEINVLENTLVYFINNTATYGGAMALLGFSVLELYSNSQVIFDSNSASERGGAIYATSPHQNEFIFSHKCFISHPSIIDPDKWDTLLNFTNNIAKYGYAIYADSLLPCAKLMGGIETNISAALRWKALEFIPDVETYTIATSPATVNFTLPLEIAPGERVNIRPMSMDDLNQTIPIAYQVFVNFSSGEANTNSYISDDGYLYVSGKPGTEFTLTVQTQSTRHVSSSQTSRLRNCPLGFILENDVCVCSAHISNRHLVGVPACNTSNFRAFLRIGYWIGCTDTDRIATSYCPLGYCNYQSDSAGQRIQIPKSCELQSGTKLCVQHRRGQLCGECEEGYTVFYHSENFKCEQCPYGAFGLLIYLVAELLPLILLFAVVMVMKLKMTSELMQSLLLFAQTVTLINHTPSSVKMSETSQIFIKIHTILFGFLNLDFLRLDELSFCLWSGATVLHNLVFRYVTTLFTILLLGIFILTNKHNLFEAKIVRIVCCEKVRNWAGRNKLFKNSIVHGISTFLMLCYTQYTVTTFQILSRLTLYGEGEVRLRSVVHLQGSVDYFGNEHLPYAIPAVLVLLFLSVPPPLLLVSYPLLWRIKAKFKCAGKTAEIENDRTVWPIRKFLPLIDSFQGIFRDNCRMFAGLLFLWRVILTAIFAFSSNNFFLLTEIALLCFFAIHAVARPYKRQLHNTIDVVMLANMSIINALTWYIFGTLFDGRASQAREVAVSIKIILMYLPLLSLAALFMLRLLSRNGLIPKQLHFLSSEEGESSALDCNNRSSKKISMKRQDCCADKDLFERAAELNSQPFIPTSSEVGFELQTVGENTDTENIAD